MKLQHRTGGALVGNLLFYRAQCVLKPECIWETELVKDLDRRKYDSIRDLKYPLDLDKTGDFLGFPSPIADPLLNSFLILQHFV